MSFSEMAWRMYHGRCPGARKDLFDDEGATQQVCELDADDRDHRAQGVLHGVFADDRPRRLSPLGHGRAHVVLVQGVDELAPDLAGDGGRSSEPQGQR